jgi:hypothetical protein
MDRNYTVVNTERAKFSPSEHANEKENIDQFVLKKVEEKGTENRQQGKVEDIHFPPTSRVVTFHANCDFVTTK